MAKSKTKTKQKTKSTDKYRPLPMSPKAGIGKGTKYGCGGKIKK